MEFRSFGPGHLGRADIELTLRDAVPIKGRVPEAPQIHYLAGYLIHYLNAKSAIIEREYIDRHFLGEYIAHYASLLRPPPTPRSTRVHFFSDVIESEDIDRHLEAGDGEAMERWLQQSYLGFVVLRPLAQAPVGRTILARATDLDSRCFAPASGRHRVHLFGCELVVEGLPFQQQDEAVGACATTAVWSMLAGCVRRDGGRPPTPLQVREAAERHERTLLPGLNIQQIANAIRAFDRRPVQFYAVEGRDHFMMQLRCYLKSGLPVLLHVNRGGKEPHAIVATGFRDGDDDLPAGDLVFNSAKTVIHTKGMARIYAHDDNDGPYGRFIVDVPAPGENPILHDVAYSKNGEPIRDPRGTLEKGIVALYPKVRLSAVSLLEVAAKWCRLITTVCGESISEHGSLRVECRFELNGTYLRELHEAPIDLERKRRLLTSTLSRYVGLVHFTLNDLPVLDLLCDTTDIDRRDPVLIAVPFDDRVKQVAEERLKRHDSFDII